MRAAETGGICCCGIVSDGGEFICEAVRCWAGADSVSLALSVVEFASALPDMPRTCWISSELRPLDSRKAILRSCGASRIDSSSRNLAACSRRLCRGVLVVAGALSELGDVSSSAGLFDCCHAGVDVGLELSSDMTS